jgi:hypothetical protein
MHGHTNVKNRLDSRVNGTGDPIFEIPSLERH